MATLRAHLLELVQLRVGQQRHDLPAERVVQVAGGFVGEHQLRAMRERAGDGHPLLLPARQHLDRPVQQRLQLEGGKQLRGPVVLVRKPVEPPLKQHVVEHLEARQQVELLKYEAQVLAAKQRQLALAERPQGFAQHPHFAPIRGFQARCDLKQGAFAATAGSEQGNAVAARQGQVDIV